MSADFESDPLRSLDDLYRASQESNEKSDLTELAKKRYITAEESYGSFHPFTLVRLSDYCSQLLENGNSKDALNHLVALKGRTRDAVGVSHPVYVKTLLALSLLFYRDRCEAESRVAFQEATVRGRRAFAQKMLSSEMLVEFLLVSLQRRDHQSFQNFMLLCLETDALSVDALMEYLGECLESCGTKDVPAEFEQVFHQLISVMREKQGVSQEVIRKTLLRVGELGHQFPIVQEVVLREVLALFEGQELEHIAEVVDCHAKLGAIYVQSGDLELAREHYEIAMEFFNQRAELEHGESSTSRTLGELAFTFGKLEESKRHLKNALQCSLDEAPENAETGRLMHNLGTLAIADENFEEAAHYLRNALDLKRRHCGGETVEAQITLMALGINALKLEDVNTARGYFHEAAHIEEELFGTETDQYRAIRHELDKIEVMKENPVVAETKIHEADVEIPSSGFFKASKGGSGAKDSAVQSFRSGVLLLHQGKVEDAAALFENILEEYPRDERIKQLVLENLADAYFSLGENEKAKDCLTQLGA